VRAARTPGTELGDKKGLWVELRRRTRLRSDPEAPQDAEEVADEPDQAAGEDVVSGA
jgi:hypothetical protein